MNTLLFHTASVFQAFFVSIRIAQQELLNKKYQKGTSFEDVTTFLVCNLYLILLSLYDACPYFILGSETWG